MAGGDLYQDSSASSSTGTITLIGTSPSAPRTRPFSVALDGQVRVLIEHQSIDTQFELVRGVYTDSTKTLTRPTAAVIFGTAGTGANTDFAPGGLIVSLVQSWGDIEDIYVFLDDLAAALAYEPENF